MDEEGGWMRRGMDGGGIDEEGGIDEKGGMDEEGRDG